MRISDWSSDVCSSDLDLQQLQRQRVDTTLQARDTGAEAPAACVPALADQAVVFGALGGVREGELGHPSNSRMTRSGSTNRHSCRSEIGRGSCRERGCQYV